MSEATHTLTPSAPVDEPKDFTRAPALQAESDGVKDFTVKRQPKRFRIDGDIFEAASAIPGETLVEFTVRFEKFQESGPLKESYEAILTALELVMLPDSYALLRKRLGDLANPIELDQIVDVAMWLLDQYGLRPTQPSSVSSGGSPSPESGTSSTGSTPPGESTSEPSPPTDS